MELFLIRHGMTGGNLEHRYVGRTDEPLTDECRKKLSEEKVCRRMKAASEFPVQAVCMSPMRRCLETAELLFPEAEYPKIRRIVIPELTECDFGEFEYKTFQELCGHPVYDRFLASGWLPGFPGGETTEEFRSRCRKGFSMALEQVLGNKKTEPDGAVVFVVHGGTIMSVMEAFAVPHRDYFSWQAGNLEGFRMQFRKDGTHGERGFCLTDVARFGIL